MPGRLPLDDAHEPVFTVGQVADAIGVQPAFLRRLDQLDVVSPARSEGAQRRYSRNDISLVQQACALIDEGLTLAGVRRVFELEAELRELKAEIATLRELSRPGR
jgi:MerR family transcriptional regulator, heat shock protein HspR